MLRLMRSGQAVRVVNDQVGTPSHATRVAQALWALAEQRAEGILHYSDAGVASWYDFAVAIQEEALARGLLNTGVSVTPVRSAEFPTPARRPHYSVLDSRSSWDRIGGPPPHWRASLREALSAMAS